MGGITEFTAKPSKLLKYFSEYIRDKKNQKKDEGLNGDELRKLELDEINAFELSENFKQKIVKLQKDYNDLWTQAMKNDGLIK